MSPQTNKTLLSLTVILLSIVTAQSSDGPPPPNYLTPFPGLPVPIDANVSIALMLGLVMGIYIILRLRRVTK